MLFTLNQHEHHTTYDISISSTRPTFNIIIILFKIGAVSTLMWLDAVYSMLLVFGMKERPCSLLLNQMLIT